LILVAIQIIVVKSNSAGRTSPIGTWWYNRTDFSIGPFMYVTQDGLAKPDRFCGNPVTRLFLKTRTWLCTLKKIMGVQKTIMGMHKVYPHSFRLLGNWVFDSFYLLKTGLCFNLDSCYLHSLYY